MKPYKPEELSDEALLKEAKTLKKTKLFDAVIFGFLMGVAIYSSFTNGLGLLSFLPLIYLPVAGRNKSKNDAVQRLLKERNL